MVATTDHSSTALTQYPRWRALGAEDALRVRDFLYRLSCDMDARAFHARAFDPADLDVFPEDWLGAAPGQRVTSAMIRVHGPQGELLWLRQGNRGMTRLEVAKPEGAEVDDLPRTPATVKVELESGEDFELEVDWSAPPADGQILLALPWMAARG